MTKKPSVPGKPAQAGRSSAAAKPRNIRSATAATNWPTVQTASGQSLRLRWKLGMTRETFARLVPMSTRNLASIESGKAPSPTMARRLTELRRVVDALAEVMQKQAIGPWLHQPNEAFDGLKPMEVIERGEVDRIWQMIYFLRSGVPG